MSDCNAVYAERNQLVAFLSRCYPSCKARDKQEDGWWIVYVDSPAGQLSWHITDEEAITEFDHLAITDLPLWDGHTSDEKYERLRQILPYNRERVFDSVKEWIQDGRDYDDDHYSYLADSLLDLMDGPRT